ncbi:MAG: hypothetical protein C5B50_14560 [Verrucomicrobia bacterium]|nr:MAG: hypothetical protein C5B50_14560 [Verrucomicrobiota bacterium]
MTTITTTTNLCRKFECCLVITAFLLATRPPAAFGHENLISNPGFESPPGTNGLPSGGWWVSEGRGHLLVETDHAVSHTGAASVKLHAEKETKAVLASKRFSVSPGDHLLFEVWMRGGTGDSAGSKTYAGLAFRDRDAKVFARAYFLSPAPSQSWTRLTGYALAPAEATAAEVHLGYTNAGSTFWFDDVSVSITNPVSLSLLAEPKTWPGRQDLQVRVINRDSHEFQGNLDCALDGQPKRQPLLIGPKATRDMNIPVTVTGVGPHTFALHARGTIGTVAELREKFRTAPALDLYPACPSCLQAGPESGRCQIEARMNVNPVDRSGLKWCIEVLDASGNILHSLTNYVSAERLAGIVSIPTAHAGNFEVAAHLLDRTGAIIGTGKTEVRVIAEKLARVTFGPDGFLRLDGVPQLPIGLYSAGHFEEMARAGFSVTHSYSITTGDADDAINPTDRRLKELLDQSWAQGMRMMVELPRKAIEKAKWGQVRRRIETFKNHPGLLCWGSEERVARGAAPLANIEQLYKVVKECDPDHPLVLGDTRDVIQHLQDDRRNFFPDDCMDAGIWWWYPFPLKEPDGNGLEGGASGADELQPPVWLTTTLSKKPLWIAFQAYQKPSRDAVFPTPAQYRCQAYLSLIYGAKGLFFYTGSGQRDYLGKPAGLLNKPDEAHWDYVQKLVRELHDFSSLFLASQPAAGLEVLSGKGAIECMLRHTKDQQILLAANRSARAQTLTVRQPSFQVTQAKVLYEDRHLSLNGDTLTDKFAPFEVHLYQISIP